MQNSTRNIIVVTSSSLHIRSGAAFSRISNYKKALGDSFNFFSIEFDQFYENGKRENFVKCPKYGIYFSSIKQKNESYFYRNIIKIFDFQRSKKIVRYIRNNFDRTDSVVLLYSNRHFILFTYIIILKLLHGYKVIVEKNELETGIHLNMPTPNNLSAIPYLIIYPLRLFFSILIDLESYLASDIIVISSKLQRLYKYHSRIHTIPILVDNQNFNTSGITEYDVQFPVKFIYLGTITKRKDAILEVLYAVNKQKQFLKGKAEFHFIGDGHKKVMLEVNNYIKMNSLESIIKLQSEIPHSDVAEKLRKYNVALLLRKKNIQTQYGFSTKLGEYLAAGLPVLTNNISDNILFLTDNSDSFFVKRVNVDEIQRKITEIIENKDQLETMKTCAKATARKQFEMSNHSIQLHEIFSL